MSAPAPSSKEVMRVIELSKDERRLVLFLCLFLLSGALIKFMRVAFPGIGSRLGLGTRREIMLKHMSPADSLELANLIERSLKGTVEEPPKFPLDLNTAGSRDLQLLPGIGVFKAEEICKLREHLGGFRSVEELLIVKGIGPKTLEKIRPYVVVNRLDTAATPGLPASRKGR